MKVIFRSMVIFLGIVAGSLTIDTIVGTEILIQKADARIGRPWTPASYAGVARRTTRRTIRRTSVYYNTLPPGCPRVYVEGTPLHYCGGIYYQPAGARYVQVNVY